MATKQYTYQTRYLAATPRNKRLTEGIQSAAQSGGGGIGYIPSSGPQYWQLVTTDAEGNALPEEQYYLMPVSGQHLHMPGDVVAYAIEPTDANQLPVSTNYNTTGLFRAKEGGGLLYDNTANAWYVDPDFQGGGGIDETQLAAYLTKNNYVTQKYLTDNGYLKLSSPLTGYQKPSGYSPITATDTLLTAIGKLEANFGNYVDLTTNQTVGGVKTFTERVLSEKDVVAYSAADDGDLGLPVAGYSTTGLVRIKDGGGIVVDSSGVISVDPDYAGGGGVNFTPGNALQLTSSGVLNVLIGTTSGTVCAGNDSRLSNDRPNPYSLSWSGYSSGSYDGSSAKSISIPSNTSQLTNGAGFIKDGNGNFTTLSGSGSSSKYLAGNGTFYTIAYSELSGTPNLDIYVTLNTTQTITAQKTFTNRVWFNGVGMLYAGPSSNVHLVIGTGSGNVINGYTASESIGNIYFNYRSGSQYTRIDASNNFATAGDVVAYSTGSSLSDFVPVATSSTYGLVKYDGSTIGKNSSGQLYVIGGTSGGGGTSVSWSSITGKPSWIGSSKPSYSWSEISGKPSWIGSSKPSYSWSEISSKPTIISSIGYSNTGSSGSGKVVTKVTASGSTVYVTYGNDQTGGGGSSFTLASASFSSNIVWSCSSSSYSIQIRRTSNYTGTSISGNTVNGLSGSSWSLGNLYLNYKSGSVNVRIDNSGRLYINGSQVTSDIRLKSIVGYEKNVLDRIMRIPVIHYTRTDLTDGMEYTGFSAQSFIGVFRNVTFLNEDSGYYGINEGAILGIAFQGLKELYARFRPVENRVKVLEQRVRNLQLRLDNAYREIFNLKQGKEDAA